MDAEIVQLPPSDRAEREAGLPLWSFGVDVALLVLALGVLTMQGDIANAWNRIKAKRAKAAADAEDEVKMLRDQIAADGLNDDDRKAIEEIKAEAGA